MKAASVHALIIRRYFRPVETTVYEGKVLVKRRKTQARDLAPQKATSLVLSVSSGPTETYWPDFFPRFLP